MKQTFFRSKSLANAEERRSEAYFETVRSILNKLEGKEPLKLKEINRQINELLKQTVKSSGIINLFTDADKEFNLFNTAYLKEITKMPQDMANASKAGNALGLSDEEMAFYDALTRPEAVKDVYTNDQLVAMMRELIDQLRKSRTVDWSLKESARAGMRRMVK